MWNSVDCEMARDSGRQRSNRMVGNLARYGGADNGVRDKDQMGFSLIRMALL